jgi:hypothetical protein
VLFFGRFVAFFALLRFLLPGELQRFPRPIDWDGMRRRPHGSRPPGVESTLT